MAALTLGELKALKAREAQVKPPQSDADSDTGTIDKNLPKEGTPNRNTKMKDAQKAVAKKRGTKAPVMLPNNVKSNPYTKLKLGKERSSRLVARDPRFSDFSGTLNEDLFRKSYSFLDEMHREEMKEIKMALNATERAGENTVKAAKALESISHMNISSVDDAKRALDRYNVQSKQMKRKEELRKLKKSLIEQEREKIATTAKDPFYYSQKKIKKIYRAREDAKMREALDSAAINSATAGEIHKKLARKNKRQMKRKPELG
ncbi:hypothetical protein BgAZ_110560 [Babesia gibsoni]|uniref:rRNA biogenesis protein RRP36 n=1 Tax=Babesia gibsoni TaxID=33632 RepID=A0AAD8USV1_BABGI|nr:hypothetical protein BgAZ_110560 [Babesia gibsoni]